MSLHNLNQSDHNKHTCNCGQDFHLLTFLYPHSQNFSIFQSEWGTRTHSSVPITRRAKPLHYIPQYSAVLSPYITVKTAVSHQFHPYFWPNPQKFSKIICHFPLFYPSSPVVSFVMTMYHLCGLPSGHLPVVMIVGIISYLWG